MRTHFLKQKAAAGFTLVEMLVSVSIFAIVMTISVGTLIVLLSAGAVAQSAQSITSNLSFAFDSISRHVRTGYDYYCTGSVPDSGDPLPSGTQDCEDGEEVFVFTEGETGDRIAYWFDDTTKALYQKVEDGAWLRMTSEDISVDPFSFTLVGSTGGDDVQPTVRMLLQAEAIETRAEVYPFFLQTTVTSKQLNI
jgi:prepilin-type N-terminal cleavage/methylation domain-containing protein